MDEFRGNREMDLGRAKCDTLRHIRRTIAEANDIPYETEECTYEGPCEGTCPKCDGEIRYLNGELQKKMDAGEAVTLEGLGLEALSGYEEMVKEIRPKGNAGAGRGAQSEVPPPPPLMGQMQPPPVLMGEILPPPQPPRFREVAKDDVLSPRTKRGLRRIGVKIFDDLTRKTEKELCSFFGLSKKGLAEVKDRLREFGLSLKETE